MWFLSIEHRLNVNGLGESMKTCLLLTALLTALLSALLSAPPIVADTTGPVKTDASTPAISLRLVESDPSPQKSSGQKPLTNHDRELATRDELRELYRDLLIRSARKERPNPYEFAEPLVALHKAIAGCERMSHNEKKTNAKNCRWPTDSVACSIKARRAESEV